MGNGIHDSVYTGNTSYKAYIDRAWTEQAACLNDPEKFEVTLVSEMEDGDIPTLEWFRIQKSRFVDAETICGSCPVKKMCYDEAKSQDFMWTFRSKSPLGLQLHRIEQRVKNGTISPDVSVEGVRDLLYGQRGHCRNGHELTKETAVRSSDGRLRCKECKKGQKERAAQRAA